MDYRSDRRWLLQQRKSEPVGDRVIVKMRLFSNWLIQTTARIRYIVSNSICPNWLIQTTASKNVRLVNQTTARYQIYCYCQDTSIARDWLIQTTARYQIYCYWEEPRSKLVNSDNGEISDILLLAKAKRFEIG